MSLSLSNIKKSFKYNVEDDISKQQMKSAMMAHQKHKQQLRKQSQVLARSKLVTNRERIQAAMQNLGQPVVPSPPAAAAAAAAAMQKSMSRSSIESDERSSDMVQRFAVLCNLAPDEDDDRTTDGEESQMTERVRNTQRSSSSSQPTNEQPPSTAPLVNNNNSKRRDSILSLFRSSKQSILGGNKNKIFSIPSHRNPPNYYQTIHQNNNEHHNIIIIIIYPWPLKLFIPWIKTLLLDIKQRKTTRVVILTNKRNHPQLYQICHHNIVDDLPFHTSKVKIIVPAVRKNTHIFIPLLLKSMNNTKEKLYQ